MIEASRHVIQHFRFCILRLQYSLTRAKSTERYAMISSWWISIGCVIYCDIYEHDDENGSESECD